MSAPKHMAEFDQLRNDLYWKFPAGADGLIRWTGYDDDYWWERVSKDPRTRTRRGEITGRTFVIDFETGEVVIDGEQSQ